MATRKVTTARTALADTKRPVKAGDGLENLVAGLGTDRDKRSYSRWSMPRILQRHELEAMYRGSWLAKKIINVPADDMTREWVQFQFDDDEEGSSQFKMEQAVTKLAARRKVNEALRWSRLYGGAMLVIGTKDRDLSKPLVPEAIRKGDLRYLQVLDRWRISPTGALVTDLGSLHFGSPDRYVVAESTVEVHHTRLIRFDGEKIPYFSWQQNGWWHDSSLQHVMDSLLNCDSASQSIATMMFESNVDVIKHPELSETLASKDGEALLVKRFQLATLMKSFNRTLLLSSDEEYEKKSNTFSNLDKIWTNFMVDVCGAADIPMTRLFGQSPGGLNSTGESDIRNYYDMIASKQEADLQPGLQYLFEIIARSEFGNLPDDFRFTFNPLWQMSESDKASVEKTRAERDQIYFNMGVVGEELIAKELKEDGVYPNMTDADVELAKELGEMNMEAREVGHEAAKQALENPDGGDDPEEAKTPQKAGA